MTVDLYACILTNSCFFMPTFLHILSLSFVELFAYSLFFLCRTFVFVLFPRSSSCCPPMCLSSCFNKSCFLFEFLFFVVVEWKKVILNQQVLYKTQTHTLTLSLPCPRTSNNTYTYTYTRTITHGIVIKSNWRSNNNDRNTKMQLSGSFCLRIEKNLKLQFSDKWNALSTAPFFHSIN